MLPPPVFAHDDDDNRNDKSRGSREATVLKTRASLPYDGTSVVCTFTSRRDVLIHSFYTDTTPSAGDLSEFDWEALTIAGSTFGGRFGPPITGIGGNRKELRDMFRRLAIAVFEGDGGGPEDEGPAPIPFYPIPLQAKKEFVVTFSTNSGNDVELDVILGVVGAQKARLRCGDTDSGNHDDDDDKHHDEDD